MIYLGPVDLRAQTAARKAHRTDLLGRCIRSRLRTSIGLIRMGFTINIYLGGGQIVHVSDQPIAVKSIIINLETTTK